MWTAQQAAELWMTHHSPQGWSELVAHYGSEPFIPEDAMQWLARTTAEHGDPIMTQLNEGEGLELAKKLHRFEEGFVANVMHR
jgi:hypothetical protein